MTLGEFNTKIYDATNEQKWNNWGEIATQKENCHIGIAWEHYFKSIMNFLYKKLCPIIWAISSPHECCMCLCGHESRTDNMRTNEMILHARCPLFLWTFTMIWCDVTQFIEITTKAHHRYQHKHADSDTLYKKKGLRIGTERAKLRWIWVATVS